MPDRPWAIGERVYRREGDMPGVVVAVLPKRLHTGGSKVRLKVRWAHGFVGQIEETQVRREGDAHAVAE